MRMSLACLKMRHGPHTGVIVIGGTDIRGGQIRWYIVGQKNIWIYLKYNEPCRRMLNTREKYLLYISKDNSVKKVIVYGATGTVIDCWWECTMVQLLWKVPYKLNILLLYLSAIVLLVIDPNNFKTYVYMKTTHRCLQQLY